MRQLKHYILTILAGTLLLGVSAGPSVGAINVFQDCTGANAGTKVCKGKKDTATPLIRNIVNTLIFLTAAISVIMIVLGGIKYTTSGGDSAGAKSAKDTILYAVIGLVVALLAYGIVEFVINRLS